MKTVEGPQKGKKGLGLQTAFLGQRKGLEFDDYTETDWYFIKNSFRIICCRTVRFAVPFGLHQFVE